MTAQRTKTEELLIERYGILLSLDELSEVLKRSRDGVRVAMLGNSEFARIWGPLKRKIGRRVYFRASDVAGVIDDQN